MSLILRGKYFRFGIIFHSLECDPNSSVRDKRLVETFTWKEEDVSEGTVRTVKILKKYNIQVLDI